MYEFFNDIYEFINSNHEVINIVSNVLLVTLSFIVSIVSEVNLNRYNKNYNSVSDVLLTYCKNLSEKIGHVSSENYNRELLINASYIDLNDKHTRISLKRNLSNSKGIDGSIDNEDSTASDVPVDNADSEEMTTYFDFAQELINQHYSQALRQSNIQFWVSIGAATVGLVFCIVVLILSAELEWSETLVKLIPGFIVELISGVFLSQATKLRAQSSDFLNRLRLDQKYEKSYKIAQSIENPELRDETIAEIALHFAGVDIEKEQKKS